MIDCRLHMDYGDFSLRFKQQLPGRGVTVFFGPSGCGKSTLLRCIAGLEQPQQIVLQVQGELWDDSVRGVRLPTYRRPIGYVFQEASLFPHLTVRGNLEFGLRRIKKKRDTYSLEHAVELLGIGYLLQRKPAGLSGGERQRVAIARALAVQPQLLLMDEPLAALDLRRKQEILPFLDRLHRELEIPVLYVTHSPQEVTRLADHIVMLDGGRVTTAGSLEATLPQLESPLADTRQASTVLTAKVISYEPEYHLVKAEFNSGVIQLPYRERVVNGDKLRLRIYARDISLSLQPPSQSSVLNVLPAVIRGMSIGEPGQVVVQLTVGKSRFLAHITQKSAEQLQLCHGMSVYAQIKATAVV
ncbi:MAG: molybdenum ABC transporter ATP-binding protein [Thiolinea sp.]